MIWPHQPWYWKGPRFKFSCLDYHGIGFWNPIKQPNLRTSSPSAHSPLAAPRRATVSTTSSSQRSRGCKEEEGPRPRGRRGGGWSRGRRGGRWGQPRVVHPAQPRMRMGKPEQEQSKHVTVLHRRRCCRLVCQVKSLLQSRSRLPSEVTW